MKRSEQACSIKLNIKVPCDVALSSDEGSTSLACTFLHFDGILSNTCS